MSAAKVLRLRDKIVKRGWQLSELYNDDRQCYLTRISGPIIDVGGEIRVWNIQVLIPVLEIERSVGGVYVAWERHFDKLIQQVDTYLAEAAKKVAAGEYLHVDQPVAAAAVEEGSSI